MRNAFIKVLSVPVAFILFLFVGALAVGAQGKTATLTVEQSAQSVKAGETVMVTIKVNSGTDLVNAVQANLSYPQDSLEFVSVDGTGSAFDIEAQKANENGVVKVARGVLKPVSGEKVVAKVNFKAKKNAASVLLKTNSDSAVIRSTDNMNILLGSTVESKPTNPVSAEPGYTGKDAMQRTPVKQSLWQRIADFFKGLFGR